MHELTHNDFDAAKDEADCRTSFLSSSPCQI